MVTVTKSEDLYQSSLSGGGESSFKKIKKICYFNVLEWLVKIEGGGVRGGGDVEQYGYFTCTSLMKP